MQANGGVRLMAGVALAGLAACSQPLDVDMRDLGDVFDTSEAVQALPNRPSPDTRGVISYPSYQVVVAQRGDTPRSIANRLGIDAGELARYNGITPETELRRDEIIALPSRVSEPSGLTGAPAGTTDIAATASAAIARAEGVTTSTLPPSGQSAAPAPAPSPSPVAAPAPAPVPQPQSGAEPIRHRVQRGETAYSIARLYNVPVAAIQQWNGLGADLTVREGAFLLVPRGSGATPPAPQQEASAPGTGSPTPVPPSASQPLPDEEVAPAAAAQTEEPEVDTPDLGADQAPAADDAELVRPVAGPVIREYSRGRNDGIDIGASAGTSVRAADAGTVAAVTTNTDGVQIVVIRHAENLLTVYTHIDNLQVSKDDRVTRGQTIGQVRAGDPSFLHFEVRQGMDSRDPNDYLP